MGKEYSHISLKSLVFLKKKNLNYLELLLKEK